MSCWISTITTMRCFMLQLCTLCDQWYKNWKNVSCIFLTPYVNGKLGFLTVIWELRTRKFHYYCMINKIMNYILLLFDRKRILCSFNIGSDHLKLGLTAVNQCTKCCKYETSCIKFCSDIFNINIIYCFSGVFSRIQFNLK